MNWLPSAVHASSIIESGAPQIDCLAAFAYPPPSNLIRRSMNWLPSAVHVSSTIESGAPRIDCLALFANPPFSIVFIVKSGSSWLGNVIFVILPIVSFAKRIYVYYIAVVFVVVCILFCVAQKKRSRDESRHRLITERARRTKSVSYLCFPLISDKR